MSLPYISTIYASKLPTPVKLQACDMSNCLFVIIECEDANLLFYLFFVIVLIISFPIFRSSPCLVVGIPVLRAICCFTLVIPTNRLQENENPRISFIFNVFVL